MKVERTVRIAVLDDYQDAAAGAADWSRLVDAELEFEHRPLGPDELVPALEEFDVVVAMRERTAFPRAVLEKLPRLRLLITTGMRNASIDLAAADDLGIVVCGTRAGSNGTPELTWALILATVRRVADDDRAVRSGGWQTRVDLDLDGQALGVVGLGRIGTRIAGIGRSFGMDVVAWSPNLTPERAAEHSVRCVSKHELFSSSFIVTTHLVLSERTRGIIGADDLRAMRPDAHLINTARAALVDQDALATALAEGWIAGAGLDVYDIEPLPADHWMRTSERTLLSPHMGYVTARNYRLFYGDAVEDVAAFLAGAPVRRLTV